MTEIELGTLLTAMNSDPVSMLVQATPGNPSPDPSGSHLVVAT